MAGPKIEGLGGENSIKVDVPIVSDPYQEYLAALRDLEQVRETTGGITSEAIERVRKAAAGVDSLALDIFQKSKAC